MSIILYRIVQYNYIDGAHLSYSKIPCLRGVFCFGANNYKVYLHKTIAIIIITILLGRTFCVRAYRV